MNNYDFCYVHQICESLRYNMMFHLPPPDDDQWWWVTQLYMLAICNMPFYSSEFTFPHQHDDDQQWQLKQDYICCHSLIYYHILMCSPPTMLTDDNDSNSFIFWPCNIWPVDKAWHICGSLEKSYLFMWSYSDMEIRELAPNNCKITGFHNINAKLDISTSEYDVSLDNKNIKCELRG